MKKSLLETLGAGVLLLCLTKTANAREEDFSIRIDYPSVVLLPALPLVSTASFARIQVMYEASPTWNLGLVGGYIDFPGRPEDRFRQTKLGLRSEYTFSTFNFYLGSELAVLESQSSRWWSYPSQGEECPRNDLRCMRENYWAGKNDCEWSEKVQEKSPYAKVFFGKRWELFSRLELLTDLGYRSTELLKGKSRRTSSQTCESGPNSDYYSADRRLFMENLTTGFDFSLNLKWSI